MGVLCAFLATACVFDYCRNKIPNKLIAIMTVAGLLLRWQREGIGGICACAGAALLTGALLYPFFRIGSLGAGDVKLFGVTAGYLPFEKILYFSFVSMLIAAIFSIIKLCRKKCLKEQLMKFVLCVRQATDGGAAEMYSGSGEEATTIRLSGPVLLAVLLLLGGVY